MKWTWLTTAFVLIVQCYFAQDGPFAPAAEEPGSTAIHADSNLFVQWASSAVMSRGWQDIADTTLGLADVGDSSSCLGPAGTNGIISLGDGGEIILEFDGYIYDGPGSDFAVFENSFSDDYLELAFVEVSSDGENYFPFNASSLTQSDSQIGPFGNLDPTYIYNLAGKYRGLYGTPFDLNELDGVLGLNINEISHVRIKDVIGAISGDYISYDSQGNAINDPYPTAFSSSGFDLDAVGAIHWSQATDISKTEDASFSVYPNPFRDKLQFSIAEDLPLIEVYNTMGLRIYEKKNVFPGLLQIDTEVWDKGLYIIQINKNRTYSLIKI